MTCTYFGCPSHQVRPAGADVGLDKRGLERPLAKDLNSEAKQRKDTHPEDIGPGAGIVHAHSELCGTGASVVAARAGGHALEVTSQPTLARIRQILRRAKDVARPAADGREEDL